MLKENMSLQNGIPTEKETKKKVYYKEKKHVLTITKTENLIIMWLIIKDQTTYFGRRNKNQEINLYLNKEKE